LKVPSRQVDPDGISVNMIQRALDRDIESLFANCDDELDLEVEVIRIGRIRQGCPIIDDRVGGREKEERWLAVRIASHPGSVGCIITAHTDDATHRKASCRSCDCNG